MYSKILNYSPYILINFQIVSIALMHNFFGTGLYIEQWLSSSAGAFEFIPKKSANS
jgi:hypothetical protein